MPLERLLGLNDGSINITSNINPLATNPQSQTSSVGDSRVIDKYETNRACGVSE